MCTAHKTYDRTILVAGTLCNTHNDAKQKPNGINKERERANDHGKKRNEEKEERIVEHEEPFKLCVPCIVQW